MIQVAAGSGKSPERARLSAGQLTDARYAAYRAQLDEDSAVVLVGAMFGAVLAASNASLRRGDPPAELAASVRRAALAVAQSMRSPRQGAGQ